MEEKLSVKMNAPELLEKQLHKRAKNGSTELLYSPQPSLLSRKRGIKAFSRLAGICPAINNKFSNTNALGFAPAMGLNPDKHIDLFA